MDTGDYNIYLGILDDVAPLIFFASVLLLGNESQIVPLNDIHGLPEVLAARSLPGKFTTLFSDYMNAGYDTIALHL